MENAQVNLNDLYEFDCENKTCVDCKAEMPKYVSINNSICICQSCALKHKALGYNVSFIREIKSEWDPYLITFIKRGGNGRFIRLIREYEIEEFPIEYKYITKAAEYHRLLIKSEVLAEEPPKAVPKPNGSEYCNLTECFFPEFENYQLYTGKAQLYNDNYTWKLYNSIQSVGKGARTVYAKIAESQMKEKVISGSSMTYNALSTAGNFLFQQSKPLMKLLSKKATQGIGLLYNQMKEKLDEEQSEIDIKQPKKEEVEDEDEDEENNEMTSSIDEPKKESIRKKRKMKKNKAKDRERGIRPKSIGKEPIRHSALCKTKTRSTSIGKVNQTSNFMNKNNIPKPMEVISFNNNEYNLIDQYNELNTQTTSIININQNDEKVFFLNNNYPSYEEIIRNEPHNNNSSQPVKELESKNSSLNNNDYQENNTNAKG